MTDPYFEVKDEGGADRGEGWAPRTPPLDSNEDPYLAQEISLLLEHILDIVKSE